MSFILDLSRNQPNFLPYPWFCLKYTWVSGAIGADFGAIWTPKQAKTKDLGGNFIDFKINQELRQITN